MRITGASPAHAPALALRYAALVLGERREASAPYVIVEQDGGGRFSRATRTTRRTARASPSPPSAAPRSPRSPPTAPHSSAATATPPRLWRSPEAKSWTAARDGLDPCAALHVPLALAPGETREVVFLFGQAKSREDVRTLSGAIGARGGRRALREVTAFWEETLGAVQIETPAPDLDVLVNGWLLYQNLACRLWGRSAFYQSGGAYGFRDQLQDSLALVYTRPDLTRAQILKNAAHQFEEGDVLHWWHPVTGAGIRTRFSDDLLWLPYAVAFTLATTGDETLLGRGGAVPHGAGARAGRGRGLPHPAAERRARVGLRARVPRPRHLAHPRAPRLPLWAPATGTTA